MLYAHKLPENIYPLSMYKENNFIECLNFIIVDRFKQDYLYHWSIRYEKRHPFQ
jgi:hypothetical protein